MTKRTFASWMELRDRVRDSKSGPWRQVSLSVDEFLQLMDSLESAVAVFKEMEGIYRDVRDTNIDSFSLQPVRMWLHALGEEVSEFLEDA